MILRYLLVAIPQVALMIIQLMFCWLIPLLINKEGHLPYLLSWFEPTDSLATGDQMFWDNEMSYTANYPERIQRYVRGFFWGIRNPAYGFADWAGFTVGETKDFKTDRDVTLSDIDVGDISTLGRVYRTVFNDGTKYFEYRHAKTWFFTNSLAWYIQLGWSFSATGNFTKGKVCHLCVYIRPFISLKPE